MEWRDAERACDDPVAGKQTMARTFAESARRHAEADAQAYKGGVYDRSLAPAVVPAAPDGEFRRLTYAAMAGIVRALAAGFRDLGVSPGDRVGILADTRMEWAQSDFALLSAGAAVTTVYTDTSPRQVKYLLSDAGAKGVVVENADHAARVAAVEADLDLAFVVVVDSIAAGTREELAADVYTLAEVHEFGAEVEEATFAAWLDERGPSDLASLVYTSGTTGQPKGVSLSHWNFKANVDQCRSRFGPRPDTETAVIKPGARLVSFLPLAHVFERLTAHFLTFASGATVAYAESPDTLREDFAAIRPTAGTSVPRVYEKIFAAIRAQASESALKKRLFEWATGVGRAFHEAEDPGPWLRARHRVADRLVFSTVRDALGGEIDFLISGGGSLSPDLCRLYHGMGLPILEGYGLTETAPVLTANPPEEPRVGTMGPPLVDVETRIDASVASLESGSTGENGRDGEGEVGELLVRGPNVAEGYWNRPGETRESFTTDGWFRTGDVVEVDAEGYLTFRERRKQILVLSTGKNVAPGPIEDAFATADLVEQCVVLGDGRKFVSALIVPNVGAVRAWATEAGIDLPAAEEALCADERVHDRIATVVAAVNENFEAHERIKRFRLVPEEFTAENDLLTPTLKKRRGTIRDRYASVIEELYAET